MQIKPAVCPGQLFDGYVSSTVEIISAAAG
jgi:hypothetical protein